MTRLPISGGWYCDALPSGEFAIFLTGQDAHIQTHLGRIEWPGEGVLYVRITNVGGFGICGQGWQSGQAWLWRAGAWTEQGPAHGTSPCIFDLAGNLLVIRPGADVTSQGYRYVDANGRARLGDETYTKQPADGQLIHEYTDVAGVTIGQGHESGAHVFIGGQRRLLEPGQTTFVRASEKDGLLAIAMVKPGESVLFWATHTELAQLPLVTPEKQPPDPIDPPDPKEPPVDLRRIDMPARVLAIVQALYDRHVDLAKGDDEQRRQLQILICEQARFELGDTWGAKRGDPGRPISKDSIATLQGGVLYSADCFNGSTRTPANPGFLEEIPGQVFQPVDPVNHLKTDPQEPPVDKTLEARVVTLETRNREQDGAIGNLDERLKKIEGAGIGEALTSADVRRIVDAMLAGYAKKGDAVTVSGKLPLFGTVTAKGSIDGGPK